MSAIYLKPVADDIVMDNALIRGITTYDNMQVFAVYDYINIVCRKTGQYAKRVWRELIRDTSKFSEVQKELLLAIPSTKIMNFKTPGMTVMGLQRLLYILDKKVDQDLRPIVYMTLARYIEGDRSMVIEVDLSVTSHGPIQKTKDILARHNTLFNTKLHGNLLRLHYNFEPPKTTMHTTVAGPKQKKSKQCV
jgi:hypothetical protein